MLREADILGDILQPHLQHLAYLAVQHPTVFEELLLIFAFSRYAESGGSWPTCTPDVVERPEFPGELHAMQSSGLDLNFSSAEKADELSLLLQVVRRSKM
jgi:hypothetical protein